MATSERCSIFKALRELTYFHLKNQWQLTETEPVNTKLS